MSDKIFDLEQQIMGCWNMVDDVDMLYHYLGDDPKFTGMSAEAEDEQANLLLGLKSLYDVKFERLFKTFEAVCSEYHKRGNELEKTKSEYANLQARFRLATQERESLDTPDFIQDEINEREDKARRRSSIDEVTPIEWDKASRDAWDEYRMDVIGQNGNDGLHYPSDFPNKHDE